MEHHESAPNSFDVTSPPLLWADINAHTAVFGDQNAIFPMMIQRQNTPHQPLVNQNLPSPPSQDDVNTLYRIRKELYDKNLELLTDIEPDETVRSYISCKLQPLLHSVCEAKQEYTSTANDFIKASQDIEQLEQLNKALSMYMASFHTLKKQLCKLPQLQEPVHDIEQDDDSENIILNYELGEPEFLKNHSDTIDEFSKTLTTRLENIKCSLIKERDDATMKLNSLRPLFTIVENGSGFRACPICLQHEVQSYVTPCGHTFCNTCLKRAAKSDCYMCRKRILSIQPIYFS